MGLGNTERVRAWVGEKLGLDISPTAYVELAEHVNAHQKNCHPGVQVYKVVQVVYYMLVS